MPEGQQSDLQEASAAEPCDHFYHHRCYRGVSIGICSNCGDPNWDELVQAKHDRDRLWRCLFDAQNHWLSTHDAIAHTGWQIALVQTGVPT